MTDTLFPLQEANEPHVEGVNAEPRVQRPNRTQLALRPVDLEALLPADHRARVVWEFVEGLELGPLYGAIKAVEGHAGRAPIDPAILMALWLYATLEGVGSARALARLCEEHDAYRWICGGVSVNYHTLADFRVAHPEVLDGLLTTSVAALLAEGLVELTRVAQDGVKIRASAGGASFRREERLTECLAEATVQVAALREQLEGDPGRVSRREAAARCRAAASRRDTLPGSPSSCSRSAATWTVASARHSVSRSSRRKEAPPALARIFTPSCATRVSSTNPSASRAATLVVSNPSSTSGCATRKSARVW